MCKEIHLADLAGFLLENADEFFADNLALPLRLGLAGQFDVETMLRIDAHEIEIKISALTEHRLDLVALVLAKKAVVNENAGELLSDGARKKSCRHRRIHTAGQPEKHSSLADFLADLTDCRLDKCIHPPRTVAPADVSHEVENHLRTLGRMKHFGVELNAVEILRCVLAGRHRAVLRMRDGSKVRRHFADVVEVAHPAYGLLRNPRKKRRSRVGFNLRPAVLLHRRTLHLAAQNLLHQLRAVAKSEHRNAEFKKLLPVCRSAGLIAAVRSAGQDDAL